MKKITLLIGLTVLSLVFTACNRNKLSEEQKKMSESHYKMGLSFFSEGNFTATLKELFKAYEYDPDNYEVNNLLGLTYLQKKEFEKAEKHLLEAIKVEGDNYPESYNNLGAVYLELERYDDAIAQFQKATDNILYVTPERAYTNLGWAYFKKGDYLQAKKNYEKSIEIEPRFSLANFNLAMLYFDLEKYDDAVKEFRKALNTYPRYLNVWYNLGLTYFKMKNSSGAKEAFEKVIEIAPDSKMAEHSKGYLELIK